MDLLRFMTAGSVDDGKSTLIGRLLHDAKAVPDDQLAAVAARPRERGELNLALLTDGLRAEREQGITIDVAYRYFQTPARKFVVADAPGHAEYTRNMVTAASGSDLAVLIIDAERGITEQTRRHACLAKLLGVPRLLLAINKMDVVGFSERRHDELREEFHSFLSRLGVRDAAYLPLSALRGDNVVEPGDRMPWYGGPTLLGALEKTPLPEEGKANELRFPVQCVIRAGDSRHYAGRVASGVARAGDAVAILGSGATARIRAIHAWPNVLREANAGDSVAIELDDDIDIGRGDMIVAGSPPALAQRLELTVCWMSRNPLRPGARLLASQGTRESRALVEAVTSRLDIRSLERSPAGELALNDIGAVTLRLAKPLFTDPYRKCRATGGLVLIDEVTGDTVGACLVGEVL